MQAAGDESERTLIAMAGLPGTGKSTLAAALAEAFDAPLLDKDEARAAMFAPEEIVYDSGQDDLVMEALYERAERLLRHGRRIVILDGRTFTRAASVTALRAAAARMQARLLVVECICEPAVARARLAADVAAGSHPAGNRDAALHERLSSTADPIAPPTLRIATDEGDGARHVAAVRAALARDPVDDPTDDATDDATDESAGESVR